MPQRLDPISVRRPASPLASAALLAASLLASGLAAAPAHSATARRPAAALDPGRLTGMEWRNIGPFRGGRVVAVTGVPGARNVFYFGGTGSGIWKSVDSGMNWQNVSDGQIGTGSVGAIAVAPSDPNVIYAGMGEACVRGNVSHGDGVYRSSDAGRTWKHAGLEIGRAHV